MSKIRNKKNLHLARLSDKVLVPTYLRRPVAFVKGKGAWLWDADGNKYLDMVAGVATSSLGYGSSVIKKSLSLAPSIVHSSNLYIVLDQTKCAELLLKQTGLEAAFFCNSGAEANEAAIKFARSWGIKIKSPDAFEIIVFSNSFHGRTMGAISATAQPKYQKGFGPLLPGFTVLPFNDPDAVKRAVSPRTCAVMFELIQGEGGVNIASDEFVKAIVDVSRENGILIIVDEVQTGAMRTGQFAACKHWRLSPDIITFAKGMGGGVPIGATLVSRRIQSNIVPGLHASTFGGNALACSVAQAVIKEMTTSSFASRVRQNGKYLKSALIKLKDRFSFIDDVRGIGLMLGVEMREALAKEFVELCFSMGLLVNRAHDNVIRLVPPLVISRREIDFALKIMNRACERLPL